MHIIPAAKTKTGSSEHCPRLFKRSSVFCLRWGRGLQLRLSKRALSPSYPVTIKKCENPFPDDRWAADCSAVSTARVSLSEWCDRSSGSLIRWCDGEFQHINVILANSNYYCLYLLYNISNHNVMKWRW